MEQAANEILLKVATTADWAPWVVARMDEFLPDHAAAEKKASSMAMTMVSHYPDRKILVKAMIDLALEELAHFRAVVRLMDTRGLSLEADEKDPYVNALRQCHRRGSEAFFLDRLLIAGIIEARGAERFGLLAEELTDPSLKQFYQSITRSELEHQGLFTGLAAEYFSQGQIRPRLDSLLDAEAEIIESLPVRAALH